MSAVLTAVTVLALLTFGSFQAGAAASFYDPPSPLPVSRNGDIIRHEASRFYVDPVKVLAAQASVQRIMYRSTDTHDRPIAVTGTVLTPTSPWTGTGQRPIVSYAVGTQGVGDDCAPSKALAAGFEYEALLARGYGVVVTDYEGLCTPGCTPTSTGRPRATRCSTPSERRSVCRKRTFRTRARSPSPGTHKGGGHRRPRPKCSPVTPRS
jgi:hypothetical protein